MDWRKPEEKERLVGRDFLLICTSNTLAFSSIYLIIPVLPLFLEDIKGYSNFLIGTLMSMLVVGALLRPYLGRASDIRGRKELLVWGTLLLGVTNFLYAGFQTAAPLFVVRLVNGLGLAAFHTASYALIGDIVPAARRLHGIALFFISIDTAIGAAPLVAEAMRKAWGYDVVYYLAGGLALLAFAVSNLVHETRKEGATETARKRTWIMPDPLQRAIFLMTTGYTFTMGALSTFVVLSTREVGINEGELFFTVFAATLIIFRLGVGKRADWWPRRPLILVSGIIVLAGLATIAFSSNLFTFILGCLIYALGFAYVPTTLSALLLDHTPTGDRGVMLGFFMAIFDVGIGLGGVAMGPIADAWGYPAMYLVAGAVALLCLSYFLLHTTRLREEARLV
ncbi:MAG: MFS transporter [Actinomycetota bacterium]|nr:MFS transporter [Actinomycetota bacterium]